MDILYCFFGEFGHGESGYPLIRLGAEAYYRENMDVMDTDFPVEAHIERTEKGKPYFTDIDMEFSLSHSEGIWVCVYSSNPCGLDVQVKKPVDWQRITKRFFNQEELMYVETHGQEGFYHLWSRREALGKCLGSGLFGDMPSLVDFDGRLREEVDIDGELFFFTQIQLKENVECVLCRKGEKRDFMIRELEI